MYKWQQCRKELFSALLTNDFYVTGVFMSWTTSVVYTFYKLDLLRDT